MSECKMSFLYEASKILPKNDCGKFIRSQLIAKLYTEDQVHLPAQNFKSSVMCRACGIQMVECPPKTKIEAPPKKNRLVRRIIRKAQENKKLTKFQRNVLKTFRKKDYQKMTSICKMCGNKVVTNMVKPDFKSKTPPKIQWREKVSKKKKKKKRRDDFSGLNSDAVLSVIPTPQGNINVLKDKNDSHEIFIVPQTINTENTNNPSNNNSKQNNKPYKRNKYNKKKNKSKFQHNKVEKNEVLKKTEKNMSKNLKRMKNLTIMLQGTEGPSSSLATFLKNI